MEVSSSISALVLQESTNQDKLPIPPANDLLPRSRNVANSLLPMLPLPLFTGNMPQFQPYTEPVKKLPPKPEPLLRWIGQAFQHNIVYQKYADCSYEKIGDSDRHWNVWACDIRKLQGQRPDNKAIDHDIKPYYQLSGPEDKTLVFESRFESGNLSMASKVSNHEYNLLLQNDINTTGYTQWFFFRVKNTCKGDKVRFNILNLYKSSSLFKTGMRVLVYSVKDAQENNMGWQRAGEDLSYTENQYSKGVDSGKKCYTFSWIYEFAYTNDELYFAYGYPYTYSDLDRFLESISTAQNRKLMKRSLLTKTLVGNRVDLLTITEEHPNPSIKKGYIVIGARVHPGQTVSSFVAKGIITFLLGDSPIAKKLRQTFIFKIVPMLNPDGVIHGNYRANISGADLNRRWGDCTPWKHHEIFNFRKLILGCEQESQVHLFCDLHGHSIKKSAFMYGNHNSKKPFQGKQFPYILGKLFKGFQFKNCSFLSAEIREGSGRSALSRQLHTPNVYTLQSSFCGPQSDNLHFTVKDLELMGRYFCQAIHIMFQPYIKDQYFQASLVNKYSFDVECEKSDQDRAGIFQELYKNKSCLVERVNSENSQGSEQEVEDDNIINDSVIKEFVHLSRRASCSPKKIKFIEQQQTSKSTSQFVIHKSPTKQKRDITTNQTFRKRVAFIPLQKKVIDQAEQQTTSTEKPIRKSALMKAAAPNNILTLQFTNNFSQKNMRPASRLPEAVKKQVRPISKYPMSSEPFDNNVIMNNFVTSIPNKITNRRFTFDKNRQTINNNVPETKGEVYRSIGTVVQKKRSTSMLGIPGQKRIEQEGDYNVFKNVLESLKKNKN